MISTLLWIKKGACAQEPRQCRLNEEEYSRAAEIAGIEIEDAIRGLRMAESNPDNMDEDSEENDSGVETDAMEDDDAMDEDENVQVSTDQNDLKAYNLDDYDNEPSAIENVNIFSNIKSMVYHADGSEDPYLEPLDPSQDEDEQEDQADLLISPDDSVLVVASTSDEISTLEFQVLEGEDQEERANLYTHHDVMLPTFPLAIEWFDYAPKHVGTSEEIQVGSHGNFVAVAGFTPDIEIWDVDVVNGIMPYAVLGADKEQKKTMRASGRAKVHDEYHTDSVLALSWNSTHRNFLASGSADTTVKLWDLESLKAVRSFIPHRSSGPKNSAAKVCLAKWMPSITTSLITGGHDATVRFFDTRSSNDITCMQLTADPEDAAWNPTQDTQIYVSSEDGHVVLLDVRQPSAGPLWTLKAHQDAASSISITKTGQTLATVGADKTLKIWDVATGKPSLSHSRQLVQLGPLFACSWCPDRQGVIAVGGAHGSVVLDLNANAIIRANNDACDSGDDNQAD